MSGKEAVPFTLKGPVSIQLIDGGGDPTGGRKTGSAIVDLYFQTPSQVSTHNWFSRKKSLYTYKQVKVHVVKVDKLVKKYYI